MNKYDKFCDFLCLELEKHFPKDYEIEIVEVVRNNATVLDSIVIIDPNRKISPNFYLQFLYEKYCHGDSIEELGEQIEGMYYDAMAASGELDMDFSYSNCKKKITFRLVSKKMNEGIEETIPSIPFLDMLIIFYIV